MCFGFFFFFQAEDGIRDLIVTGVQTCALPISGRDLLREAEALQLGGAANHQPPQPGIAVWAAWPQWRYLRRHLQHRAAPDRGWSSARPRPPFPARTGSPVGCAAPVPA